ncbi:MAG: transglycosylase family protein [Solirubrobacteraceae bacterium]|nr:transglycosylase family protein [Solirubrobacteraceae bacterium]
MTTQRLVAAALTAATIAAALAGTNATTTAAHHDCHTKACAARVQHRALERHYQRTWRAAPPAVRAHLRRIAQCESRGNHRATSPSGRYRGLLQFLPATWRAVGGRGDPAAATRWEQWARGARLYLRAGPDQWPACSKRTR